MAVVVPSLTLSPLQYPSAENAVLPKETGMVQAFIRNPEKFTLNRWLQYIPVGRGDENARTAGAVRYMWSRLERDAAVRVTDDLNANIWKSGSSRKGMGNDRGTRFSDQTGICQSRNEAAVVGHLANELQPRYDMMATEIKSNASRMMTVRTLLAINQLQTGNWQGNTAAANSLNLGRSVWNKASDDPYNPRYNAISSTILQAKRQIALITNNVLEMGGDTFRLLMNPDDAILVSLAPEIRHLKAHTPEAFPQMQEGYTKQGNWGMPTHIEGVEIVIEDTPYVSSNPNNSGGESTPDVDRKWALPSGTVYLLARPGSLEGAPGSISFSTIQCFFHGPLMQAEAFPDAEDRLTRCHTSECIDIVLACGLAGYQITNIIG